MRLVTYDRGGARRLGAWVGEAVVDLPTVVGHPAFPTTMEALIALHGGTTLDAAREALSHPANVKEFRVAGPRLLPPIVPISLLEHRWILGPEDGGWYRRERDRWIAADPPRRLVCPDCGHHNLPRHSFCVECGRQLNRSA